MPQEQMAFTPPPSGDRFLPGAQQPLSPSARRGPPSALRHAPGGLGAALRGRSGQYKPGQRYGDSAASRSASSRRSPSPVKVICGPSRSPSPTGLQCQEDCSHHIRRMVTVPASPAACASVQTPRQAGPSMMAAPSSVTQTFPQAVVLPGVVGTSMQGMMAQNLASPRLSTTRTVVTHSSALTNKLYMPAASARFHPWQHVIPTPAAALRVSSPVKVSGGCNRSSSSTAGTPSAWTPACSGLPMPHFTAVQATPTPTSWRGDQTRTPSPTIAHSSVGERRSGGRSITVQPGNQSPVHAAIPQVEPAAAVLPSQAPSQGPLVQTWLQHHEDASDDKPLAISTRGSCSCSAPSVVDLPDASGCGTPAHPPQQANAAKLFFTVPLASTSAHPRPPSPHGLGWPTAFPEKVHSGFTTDVPSSETPVGSDAEAFLSSASAVGQAMTTEKGLEVSAASSSTTAAVGSTAGDQDSCEGSRLAALERRCLHLEQSLVASEMEKERLTGRLRHLEENAARVTQELQRKEEQVGELNLQSSKLARALMEVTAERSGGAASGSGSPFAMQQDARVFEGAEVLQSPDDEEEHLGNVSTLAALRERLYREYDGKVNGGIGSLSSGGTEAVTSPSGSPRCTQEGKAVPPPSPPPPAPAPPSVVPTQRPTTAVQSSGRHRRLGTRSVNSECIASPC